MKKILKKFLPNSLVLKYHYILAWLWAFYYRFPSKKMVIIGVTGTKGKTSTINFLWSCLTAGGYKVGIISTANIRIGSKEFLNKYHMTMPGRSVIQRLMKDMLKDGCNFCIVETTSEGIKQSRHIGIFYDIAVFTNLTPEHLTSHGGSFEKYKEMKGKLFSALKSFPVKVLNNENKIVKNGGTRNLDKFFVINRDDQNAQYFLSFDADQKATFGIADKGVDWAAKNIKETAGGVEFSVVDNTNTQHKENQFKLNILGKFNVYNALPAIIISNKFGVDDRSIYNGLANLRIIPGRMERIEEGQSFVVIVDYAHEKQSITNVLTTARVMADLSLDLASEKKEVKVKNKTIVLLGAEGGGRDKAKRPAMGEISAKLADIVVVSNVDPYSDDPKEILEDIAKFAEKFGKTRNKDLFVIEDRRMGIKKALSLASGGDIVLITGKGAEQSMIIGGKSEPWDDRVIVREELKKILEK